MNLKLMSRLIYTSFFFLIVSIGQAFSQVVIYTETFNSASAPDLPSGWSVSSTEIFTNASSPSSGYSGASGGNNLLARNCNPNGEVRSFQIDGISTIGATGLTVSFGHRRTSSFTPSIALEWSSDGSSWNAITYSTPGTAGAWALFTSAMLPAGAENQANLRVRWTYSTSVSNVPCDNFAGNYRLDDFKVTAVTLPIELVKFSVSTQPTRQILLSWQTTTERDNALFAIEHSTDGNRFTQIGQTPGAGNSFETRNYQFTDLAPTQGTNYYRLRQVDVDGRSSYSPVVTAVLNETGNVTVMPTPATDQLQVQLEDVSEESIQWKVYDYIGRTVLSGTEPGDTQVFSFDVSTLAQGAYTLSMQVGTTIYTKLVIKR